MKSVLLVSLLVLFISQNMAANSCVANSDNCVTCVSAAQTTDVYKCATCDSGFFATTINNDVRCRACGDEFCSICDAATLVGHCSVCQTGYNLVGGACESPLNAASPGQNATQGALVVTVIYQMTLDEFYAWGGEKYYGASIAKTAGVSNYDVDILKVEKGSVIITFRIFALASSSRTLAQIRATIEAAYHNGGLAYYPGVRISSFSASIQANTCPSGEYPDSTGKECIACPKDCPNCISATECNKKRHVIGAVLGSVLGSLAVILLACILIVKRDYLKQMMSGSESPKTTRYNLAASSPTSPTVQTEAVHA